MDIAKLDIENFLTIGKAKLELDGRGLVLIQGKNGDDTSAESNGAGKSSIVDALCWAIYGVTARGVSTDAVVNRAAKKNCRVSVDIVDATSWYRITRYRKDSTHKNQVIVTRQDGPSVTDLSKGTERETQAVIDAIMGCSLEVFMAAVYAGQEKMPDLPGMTDKMLKMLIEEAAGVEVLAKAYETARARLATANVAVNVALHQKRLVEGQLEQANEDLALRRSQSTVFDAERKDRAKAELARAVPFKRGLVDLEAEFAATDEGPLIAEHNDFTAALAAHRAEQGKLDALRLTASNAGRQTASVKARLDMATLAIKKADAAAIAVGDQVGKPCGECGKDYHEDDLAAVKTLRMTDASETRSTARTILTQHKDAVALENTATDAATAFAAAMTDVTAVAASQRDLSIRITAIRELGRKIEDDKKTIEAIGALAKLRLSEANPWSKMIEVRETEALKAAADIAKIDAELATLTERAELLGDAVKVFGPSGVRAHILDTVTPYLNARTQEYLGALSDGNIHAEWNTLTKNAKGELKEKFSIEVTNDKGSENFLGLSGGEKRKVRLATAMALQDMVASRASKPINIFIADEVDHALDKGGLERLMTVLERKARERGTVLVISHNSLSDWIDSVITVTKTGGTATVSGATEHGF